MKSSDDPLWLTRLFGVPTIALGVGLLYVGIWLFGWIGWSARILFFAGGASVGVGLGNLLVPESLAALMGEEQAPAGSVLGRWVARACVGVGIGVGVGVWLYH